MFLCRAVTKSKNGKRRLQDSGHGIGRKNHFTLNTGDILTDPVQGYFLSDSPALNPVTLMAISRENANGDYEVGKVGTCCRSNFK